jgi:hypothetical protein
MNRVETVKSESLSRSYEDSTTVLTSEYTKMALILIEKGISCVKEALSTMVGSSPSLAEDKDFVKLFPTVFKRELSKASKSIN